MSSRPSLRSDSSTTSLPIEAAGDPLADGSAVDPHSAPQSGAPLPRSTGERKAGELGAFPLPRAGGEVAPPDFPGETEWGCFDASATRSRRKPGTTARARDLRQRDNQAEALLWLELKRSKLGGYKFTRQFPIGPYFADFACRAERLVVELDGSQHGDSGYDRKRDEFMRSGGYSVLRFWNTDVLKQRTSVCETILAALDGRLSESVVASDLRFVFAPQTNSVSKRISK
jgi:very-short-patch-repair endonuclease